MCFLVMSQDNVLSFEEDAKDVEITGSKFGMITKLMVLTANVEEQTASKENKMHLL